MTFITFDEVRELYGFSYREARRLLNKKGCPLLPRTKGQNYKVNKERFEEWLDSQTK